MKRRSHFEDHRVIGAYTGKIVVGVGLLQAVPLFSCLLLGEWDTALDFVIGMSACFIVGFGLQILGRTKRELGWNTGLVVASGSWLLLTVLGAIPLWLSGHEGSYLDAVFDVMSGLTTTGLYLMQDLDHASYGLNMWRHLLTYAGGQGVVVVALTFLFTGAAGAYSVYVGEGKDERLFPNVVQTARAIWLISLVWLAVGWVVLAGLGLWLGQEPTRAVLHGLWIFMGGWSTGGFAPQSFNTVYYHSIVYELATIVIFVAGSFNFALHWAVWSGRREELRRNIETMSFAVTLTLTVALATWALARFGVYPDAVTLFRKAFYQVVSGHTTTGFSTIYSRAFVRQWGQLGMLAVTIAMAIGASACSTAGGIKGLRIGVMGKAFILEIRKMLSPPSAVVVERYRHVRNTLLSDAVVRSALLITIAYITLYGALTILGMMYGYSLSEAMFEGVSAASNTGLSCGVTAPSMPGMLKVAFIFAMWLGRLEFMSVFALIGYVSATVRGR